jgi:hypothetical protein
MKGNTMKFKALPSIFAISVSAVSAGAASNAYAGLYDAWVPQCAALPSDADKLACFKKMTVGIKPPDKQLPWNAETQAKLDTSVEKHNYFAAKDGASEEKHADDRWFLRSTTQIGDDNVKPAKIALTRSKGDVAGIARAAVIYVDRGGISDALGLEVAGDESWYVGVGVHRDDTVAAKKVSTSDLRLGYRKAFSVFPKKTDGKAVGSWVSIARLNDHVASNAQIQTDLGVEAAYRWLKLSKYDEVEHDRSVKITFNPFSDKTFSDPTGNNTRTSGIGLGLALSWYRPTDVDWIPKTISNALPDRWSFTSLRNVGTASTKQYSTLHKLGFSWAFAKNDSASLQPSITLAREVGANFREGLASSAKTLLTLDVKLN